MTRATQTNQTTGGHADQRGRPMHRPRRPLLALLALATGTVTATGLALTPAVGHVTSPNGAAAHPPGVAAAAQSGIQHPVFRHGMAMPVFSTDPSTYVVQELWVRSSVDSDHDGQDDLVHIDVTRPEETERGLKVPVVFEASPYYSGGNAVHDHNVDHKLYAPRHLDDPWPGSWGWAPRATTKHGPGPISDSLVSTWVPRGFAVVHAESLGTGGSQGCPTSGGRNETLGIKAVIDWLNGRTTAVDSSGAEVSAYWTTGKVGMIGTSYNGTLPNAVAATGVKGLKAIIPVSAISSWYDYYRSNGAVIAPGGYQGEDLDVLARYVYTRPDREICRPVIRSLNHHQDRKTGDYSAFWNVRNYVQHADRVHAGVLVAHGLSDWNVKTTQAAQWYLALKAAGVPHRIYWHQGGHGGDPPLQLQVRWFTHFLFGRHNGVEHGSLAWIQREDGTIVKYADWPDPSTQQVTFHLTPRGDGAVGGLTAGAMNAARPLVGQAGVGRSGAAFGAALDQGPGQGAVGLALGPASTALTANRLPKPVVERIVDTPDLTARALAGAPDSPNGRVYVTQPLATPTRISGIPSADLRLSFGQWAANVSVALADLAPDGTVTRLVTEGWRDPQNRDSLSQTEIVTPGQVYRLSVPMQANDYVFPAGHRIAFVLLETDHDFTIRPPAGNVLALRTLRSTVTLPIVGGFPPTP